MPADTIEVFSKIVHTKPTGSSGILPRGSIGAGCVVEAPFYCEYGYHLRLGSGVIIGRNCSMFDSQPIMFGDRVTINANITLDCNLYSIIKGGPRALPFARGITIQSGALVQTGVIISAGVIIGEGSVIEPGSVVCHDVPRLARVRGNPAKIVS